MVTHPLYIQKYVLSNNKGKCRLFDRRYDRYDPLYGVNQFFEYERTILDDWCRSSNKTDVKFWFIAGTTKDRKVKYCGSKNGASFGWFEGEVWKMMFHKLVLCHTHYNTKKNKTLSTAYTHGWGVYTKSVTFTYPVLEQGTVNVVNQQTAFGEKFSPIAMVQREKLFGSSALSRDMSGPVSRPSNWFLEWQLVLNREPAKVQQFRQEYLLFKELHTLSVSEDVSGIRLMWEEVFTSQCTNPQAPCGTCQQCSIRAAQAAIVVYAAQGVADLNVLPYLGSVFRFPRYQHCGIKEWAMVSIYEIAQLLKPCSSHGLKAWYVKGFLQYLSVHMVPYTLENFVCFYGFKKKSACLFLSAVCGRPFGIPVDRHLKAAFLNCGWVHPNSIDETCMSYQVELWLPMEETADINNVLASLRQLYQKSDFRRMLRKLATECGPKYESALKLLTSDINIPSSDLEW
jgi:hypothetical protein